MKKIMTCTLVFMALGCSSTREMIDVTGVERVQIDQQNYTRPAFYIGEFKAKKAARSIASVVDTSVDESLSNRQLYFLSLYGQYQKLASLVGSDDEINACPSFHNLLIEHPMTKPNTKKLNYSKLDFSVARNESKDISLYPVLALPYSGKVDLYTKLVSENWQNPEVYVEQTLQNLLAKNKQEVAELCDKGVSPGYYVFENIVTYFKTDKKFYGTNDGLAALLKVHTLGNMIVLDNLSHTPYSFNKGINYDSWLLSRSNANWFSQFRDHLNTNRESRISTNYKR